MFCNFESFIRWENRTEIINFVQECFILGDTLLYHWNNNYGSTSLLITSKLPDVHELLETYKQFLIQENVDIQLNVTLADDSVGRGVSMNRTRSVVNLNPMQQNYVHTCPTPPIHELNIVGAIKQLGNYSIILVQIDNEVHKKEEYMTPAMSASCDSYLDVLDDKTFLSIGFLSFNQILDNGASAVQSSWWLFDSRENDGGGCNFIFFYTLDDILNFIEKNTPDIEARNYKIVNFFSSGIF